MKAIIFNGALERRTESISGILSQYLDDKLKALHIASTVFNIVDSGIPLFETTLSKVPHGVTVMNNLFQEADIHFWLAPLYHGSIPGVMKNCLDWLEISAKNPQPYLTDKLVGMVCWADGAQAMQGINTMDAVAKSLRAWPLPYSVPIQKSNLWEPAEEERRIADFYKTKLDLLVDIATSRRITTL